MSDIISRQSAIDAIEITPFDDYGDYMRARELIEQLPSAQPEIIRCKDCKHWLTVLDKDIAKSGLCNKYSQLETTKADDYCSRSKRKEE